MLIEKLFPEKKEELIYNVFGDEQKLFDSADLSEYFAEKNTSALTNELGEQCIIGDIDSNFASKYKGFPEGFQFDKSKITDPTEYFRNCINYFDGEIWNGRIDNILKASLALRSM